MDSANWHLKLGALTGDPEFEGVADVLGVGANFGQP